MQLNKIEIDFDNDSSEAGGASQPAKSKFFTKVKNFFQNKKFVLVTFLIGGIIYYFAGRTEKETISYLSIPFFIPSLIFLYSEFKETFFEINIIQKVFFLLGEFTIIYYLSFSDYYDQYIFVSLIADYLIFFLILQIFTFIFWVLKSIASSIVYYFTPSLNKQRKRKFTLNNFIFKKAFVFILILFALGFLGWRNWQLTQRVSNLESAIGESRLLCDEKESVAEVKKSVVRIIGRNAQGSGFVIEKNSAFGSSDRYILTNHHVVKKNITPKVILPGYTVLQGKVVAADKDMDLAIVKVDQGLSEIPSLEIGNDDNLENLDELVAIGYPWGTSIRGESTANKGNFVSIREMERFKVDMVQADLDLTGGMSGGPVIDICGKVYAINTMGDEGVTLSVSVSDFMDNQWYKMMKANDPLADIEKIEIKPNGSPLECVKAFYNYQTTGELKKAYDLLSTNYTDWTFERWEKGYADTLYVVFVKAEEVEDKENTVFVKFYSADLKDEKLVERYFEGEQSVKKYDGQWKLEGSNIKEIKDPKWSWFWDY